MVGSFSTRPSLCRGFAIRHHVKPRHTCVLIAWYSRLYFSDEDRLTRLNRRKRTLRNHYGYCSTFQGYGKGHLLVWKDLSYSIVFEQCAERSWSDRIKRGVDTELTTVTQNLFDNPEKAFLGHGLIQIYLRCRQYLSFVRDIINSYPPADK